MNHVKLFDDWKLNEAYRSDTHNLYKVAQSKEPIMGPPVFIKQAVEDNQKHYKATQDKIDDCLKGYDAHMIAAEQKHKEWMEKATKKYEIEWYTKSEKNRKFAHDILKRSAVFFKKFNELYDKKESDLINTDHVKVAKAIIELNEIYPYDLIRDAGQLKRTQKMKFDADFINTILKWTNFITSRYDALTNGAKILGKTEKQLIGARKQSANMRMRWGM